MRGPGFDVQGRIISDHTDCYVIAEIGHNHQGDVEQAKKLIKAARDAGCDAAKLQKRHNLTLYTREMYERPYNGLNSFGNTYGAHREYLEFGREKYRELQKYAAGIGIAFFSTAFDGASADFLAELDVPAFKLASGDITNTELQKHVARIGKPMIVSTGTGTLDDVRRAYDTILPINPQLALLQCTASYPARPEDLHLNVIPSFRETFPGAVIGASLHDLGTATAVAAFALGARVIEKHFTLGKSLKGTDHSFSLEPAEMAGMVRDLRAARAALGEGVKRALPCESGARSKMGKSLYAACPLPAGIRLKPEHIAIRSPGGFLPPYEISDVVGRVLTQPLRSEEPILREHLDGREG